MIQLSMMIVNPQPIQQDNANSGHVNESRKQKKTIMLTAIAIIKRMCASIRKNIRLSGIMFFVIILVSLLQ